MSCWRLLRPIRGIAAIAQENDFVVIAVESCVRGGHSRTLTRLISIPPSTKMQRPLPIDWGERETTTTPEKCNFRPLTHTISHPVSRFRGHEEAPANCMDGWNSPRGCAIFGPVHPKKWATSNRMRMDTIRFVAVVIEIASFWSTTLASHHHHRHRSRPSSWCILTRGLVGVQRAYFDFICNRVRRMTP